MKLNRLFVLPLLAALSCEPEAQSAPSPNRTVSDSAGIRIVENARPPDGSRLPWRIGPEPVVSARVRGGHSPLMRYSLSDATRLRDGRIAVAHREAGIRVFNASGRYVGTWGGMAEYDPWSGTGWTGETGEVMGPWGVAPWPGDSIVAWGRSRETGFGVTVFDTDGNYGRSFTLVNGEGTTFLPEAATRDGSILASFFSERLDTIVFQIRDSEGEVRSSLGTFPGFETYLQAEGASEERVVLKIFGRHPVATPWGDLVVVGNSGRYELEAFGADGSLVLIVTREHAPRSPGPGDVEAYIEEEAFGDELISGHPSVPVAEHLPVFAGVMSDALDHLWVEEYEVPRAERPAPIWTVFDPEGHGLGFVETPRGLDILEIGENYILGRVLDERGYQHVQIWSLERTGFN